MNHIPTNENHRGDPQSGDHHPRIGHHSQQHHPHPQHLPHHPGQPPQHGGPPPTYNAFKVLVDPMIHKGAQKIVRYDGVYVPGDPMHIPPIPKDPRKIIPHALWKRFDFMDLTVPRFKVDDNYVADPPKTEVTIENLNDNVDVQFLRNMTAKFGPIEELTIHYHPITRKHLGLARLVFEEIKSARECVKNLHGKSVMGQQLNCYLDPRGASCQKMFFEMTTEQQKPEPKPPTPEETVPEDNVVAASPKEEPFNSRRRFERDRDSDRYHEGRYSRDREGSGIHRSEFGSRERGGGDGRWSNNRGDWSRDHDHPQHHHHDAKQHPMYNQHHHQNRPRDFDPSYSQPDYWLQQAQKYAQQAQTAPLPQNANDSSGEHETGGEAINEEDNDDVEDVNGEVGEHQVDLDTRLKMLMRDRTGAMPAFLLQEFNSSDSSDKEADAEVAATLGLDGNRLEGSLFKHDPLEPLSTPPSPFISKKHYKKNMKWRVKHSKKAGSKASDQMSLSSLPSIGGGNKQIENDHQTHHFPPFSYYPTHLPGQPQYHQHPHMAYQHQIFYSNYPGFHAPHGFIPPSHYMGWENTAEESMAQPQETREVTVKDVVNQTVTLFVDELRRALSKDLQKKMCETYAFNVFDQWWDEREKHYHGKRNPQPTMAIVSITSTIQSSGPPATSVSQGANKENTSSNIADRSAVSKLPRIPKAEMLSSIFAKQRENLEANRSLTGVFGAGGSLGFGFRGTIPKLPSFKRKPTITSQLSKRRSPKRSDSMSTDDDSNRKKKSDRRKDHENRRAERMEKVRRETKVEDRKHGKKSSSRKDKGRSDELSDISSDDDFDSSQVKAKDETWRRKKKSSVSSSPAGTASSDSSSKSQKSTKRPESSENASKSQSPSSSSSSSKSSSASGSSSSSSSSSSGSSSSSNSESDDSSVKESASGSESSSSSSSDDEKALARRKRMAPSRRAEVVPLDAKENYPNGKPIDIIDDAKSEPSAFISDHSYAKPIAEKQAQFNSQFSTQFANEHDYSRTSVMTIPNETPKVENVKATKREPLKPRKRANVEAVPTKPIVYPPQPTRLSLVKFKPRSDNEEYNIMFKFLTEGLDLEDARYFKVAYKMMLSRDDTSKILNFTHWVDHPVAEPSPPKKKKKEEDYSRPHLTGCCRTEGYYKMDPREKRLTKYHLQRPDAYAAMSQSMRIANTEGAVTKAKGMTSQNQSREARNIQRRQLAVIGEEAINSDLLKFNQLKFRRKQLSFGKSAIHDWGLFAQEDIGADEMVIEYVGEVIRPHLSDLREMSYEKLGIRSSYLFRIDQDSVVDATKCGSLSRFINHSCEPNCYAKIITIEGEKKIVIYSKQPIASGEEITYDYKFPVEDEKIPCLCGAKSCRKYLN